ncbi:hypothetical protein RRG08_026110 [Elysia crispata]|uniref:Uncharacterized protein n=1 Tax=Elysia crispata TaxID=231223 RepID=A0AAE0YRJ1_9GAST|nr:hypothetical protein RRG08_026110 [Elysia crispata]
MRKERRLGDKKFIHQRDTKEFHRANTGDEKVHPTTRGRQSIQVRTRLESDSLPSRPKSLTNMAAGLEHHGKRLISIMRAGVDQGQTGKQELGLSTLSLELSIIGLNPWIINFHSYKADGPSSLSLGSPNR